MTAQKKSPVKRANAYGAVFAASPCKGNHSMHSTASKRISPTVPYPAPAYYAAIHAGIESAHAWFAKPAKSMGETRDDDLLAYIDLVIGTHEPGQIPLTAALDGFEYGFNRGVELIIGGGRHAFPKILRHGS